MEISSRKILQINVVANSGSTGRITEEIGNLILKEGWESYIAYGRRAGKSSSNLIKIGNKLDQYIHVLNTRIFDRHGLSSSRATRKLIKSIQRINPDLIHIHNLHGYYINYKILSDYLKRSNRTIIWTLHDCWLFTGHCPYFDFSNCDRWKNGCFKCPQKNQYPASLALDRSKRNYADKRRSFGNFKEMTLVPVSGWLSGILKESFIKNHPVNTIRNGININDFKPSESAFRKKHNLENKPIILGVANVWDRRKGFEDFLKLSDKINEDTRIVLVGLSKKQIKKLPKNILGLQRTNSMKELAEIYSTANVFFNATYEDNYPTTNLEAIACGTPVITYNTGGSVESITKETGAVIEKGAFIELVDILSSKILPNMEKYRINCRQHAIENFDKDKAFIDYIRLYKSKLD